MTPATVVLVPAFNESKSLGSLIPEIRRYLPEVLVIDDGSTDESARVAARAGASVLRHSKNSGKGAALQTGFQYVLEKGYEGCLVIDGDGQHSPKDIPLFLKAAEETSAAMVIGNRMGDVRYMPIVRRLTNRLMSSVLSYLLKENIPDTQCGYRYIRSNLLKTIELQSLRYDIESELSIEARRNGFHITSVPIQTIYSNEKSGIHPFRDTLRFLKLLYVKRDCFRHGKIGK